MVVPCHHWQGSLMSDVRLKSKGKAGAAACDLELTDAKSRRREVGIGSRSPHSREETRGSNARHTNEKASARPGGVLDSAQEREALLVDWPPGLPATDRCLRTRWSSAGPARARRTNGGAALRRTERKEHKHRSDPVLDAAAEGGKVLLCIDPARTGAGRTGTPQTEGSGTKYSTKSESKLRDSLPNFAQRVTRKWVSYHERISPNFYPISEKFQISQEHEKVPQNEIRSQIGLLLVYKLVKDHH